MREYGFSMTRILPYRDKIYEKVDSHIFYAVPCLSVPLSNNLLVQTYSILLRWNVSKHF